VVPDPHKSCGPYSPVDQNCLQPLAAKEDEEMSMMRSASKEDEEMRMMTHASATDSHHDTMGIVTLDVNGNVAGGTTTNGATFKIPGYVAAVLVGMCEVVTRVCSGSVGVREVVTRVCSSCVNRCM